MNLYDQLSQELPAPNDTWTKHDILLYKLILTVAASVTDLNKEATQLLVKTAVDNVTAKLIVAPATEGKQDTGNTSLASILAKLIVTPATEGKQDTGNTSLASILAKIIAAPATEAKQDTGNTSLASILALQYAPKGNELKGHTATVSTTAITALISSPGIQYDIFITSLLVTNAHATVGTVVNIVDTFDDTVLFSGYAAPAGGGFSVNFPTPLKNPTKDYSIAIQCMTAGAAVIASAVGFKAL